MTIPAKKQQRRLDEDGRGSFREKFQGFWLGFWLEASFTRGRVRLPGARPLPVPQNAWDEAVGVDAMHDQGSCLMAISPLRSFGPIPAETEVAPSTVTPFLQTP